MHDDRSPMVEFGLVDPMQGREAYQWHRGFAASNDFLFPRPWQAYEQLATEGRLWCARGSSGDYLGLAYFSFDDARWEIGGLMVSTAERRRGLASTIARLTLGHVLFEEDPFDRRESIITHVHVDNREPRGLLEHVLRFRFARKITVPGSKLPGLRTNSAGNVEGDEFELANLEALDALAHWCDSWHPKLKDGRDAQITLRPGTSLAMWAEAFRDMALRERSKTSHS